LAARHMLESANVSGRRLISEGFTRPTWQYRSIEE